MIKKLKSIKASASFGVAVSVMLSLVLMFSGIRLYQITSSSASAQETADASVLGAEAEVAKFYTVANAADTAILTMNATQYVMWGAAVVMACTANPAGSAEMIAQANKVGSARTKFSVNAKKGLNAYQTALPFLAAARSSSLTNSNQLEGDNAKGVAVLVPLQGTKININSDELDSKQGDVEGSMDEVQKRGEELKRLSDDMDDKNSRAYQLDCGDNPGYCLYERAGSLADMPAGSNPFYSSADAWDFNVAFLRSCAYFNARQSAENPYSQTSVRERSRSFLRKDYYAWVSQKMQEKKNENFDPNSLYDWPEIYHNAQGFRESERYYESIYPITEDDGKLMMHSNAALKCASGYQRLGSCADWDEGSFEQCEECEFSTSNTGNIGSATTNTLSGFEHYFQEIRKLKGEYDEAKRKYDEESEKMRDNVNDANGKLGDFLSAAKRARINVEPPGRDGAIYMSMTTHSQNSNTISNAFVSSTRDVGDTFAVSGAKLEVDPNESGLALVAKRLKCQGGGAGASIWNSILDNFGQGQGVGAGTISENAGGNKSRNAVGTYANDLLEKTLDAAGLRPADWSGKKPVIVNTEKVVENESDSFAKVFKSAQSTARKAAAPSTDFADCLSSLSNTKLDEMFSSSTVDVASVDVPFIGKVGLTIDIGDLAAQASKELVNSSIDKIENVIMSNNNERSWK